MITMLLRKDLRVYRDVILANIILIAAIYSIAAIAVFSDQHQTNPKDWLEGIIGSAVGSIAITCLLAGAYGGVAFAQERRERSAHFLAMLPVARRPIVLSKCVVSIFSQVAFIAANVLVLFIAATYLTVVYGERPDLKGLAPTAILDLCITAMLFGSGWLLSAMLESSSIATSISIGGTIILNVLIALIVQRRMAINGSSENFSILACSLTSLPIGVACFVYGTVYYLKRVEP
jgi:ABC-type transport system involved in multi-copper enzyme maturation permease subunit